MEEVTEATEAAQTAGEEFMTKTSDFIDWVHGLLTWENLFKLIGGLLLIFIMWIVYRLIIRAIKKSKSKKMDTHKKQMLSHFIKYIFYVLVVLEVLSLLGIKLSALLGAAGIAGVAIGFAAQTSVSNLISGLFVLTEGSIKVGDTVTVDGITGVVDEINLLSVHINTFDNHMVRIPNSTIINSDLTNINYHKTRRMTIAVSVDYSTDMKTAIEALKKAPALCPTVVADPAPAAWFDGFADSGINMTLAAWFKPADFLQTKNDLYIAIKTVLDEAGITIPFNQLDVRIKEDENPEIGGALPKGQPAPDSADWV
ncbi:MAG: mechanosensitive ion channel family protein [Treponema sp.]|nr:mechanosensitive ion channel family protein [Treponema sp.]